jgi:replicative DNA helicase
MANNILPHSDDAERAVLGASIIESRALYDITELLDKDDFFRDNHQIIFEAILSLHSSARSVDLVTVSEELKKSNLLDKAGGPAYLGELVSVTPTAENAVQYAAIVRDNAMLRQLIKKGSEIVSAGYENEKPVADIISEAEDRVLEIAQASQRSDVHKIGKVLEESLKDIKKFKESGRKLRGLATGFPRIDKITSGLQRGDLIVLAARPSMGKTSLALNIALNAAKGDDATVLIFSIEMGRKPLGNRLLSSLARVPLKSILDGSVYDKPEQATKLADAQAALSKMDIHIDESAGDSINEMKNKCRRVKQSSGKLDLVVIDYVQLMSLTGSNKNENRTQELAVISRGLKLMARDIDCPVLLLSQVGRDSERRKGRPMLSDLRDSGAIEQDGDLIMFIHNMDEKEESDYNKHQEEKGEEFTYDRERMRQLLILKHRNGETGDITLSWDGQYTKFGEPLFGSLPTQYQGPASSAGTGYDGSTGYDEADGDEGADAPPKILPF